MPDYVKSAVTALKSWLSYSQIELTRKIKVPGSDDAVSLSGEKVPERGDLKEILSMGTLKARILKQLMAKSGMRPQAVGNYNGTDGLRPGNLPNGKMDLERDSSH